VLVAAWPSGEYTYSGTTKIGRLERRSGIGGVGVVLRNASVVPVTEVTVTVHIRRDDPDSTDLDKPWIKGRGELEFSVLPPNEGPEKTWVDLEETLPYEGNADFQAGFDVHVTLWFTDAAGVRWARDLAGLHRDGLNVSPR
jgi:hypothetical protein